MAKLFTLVGPCDTYDLDSMLNEAIAMVQNANSRIDQVTSGVNIPLTSEGRIADNARNMFNTGTFVRAMAFPDPDQVSQEYLYFRVLLLWQANVIKC